MRLFTRRWVPMTMRATRTDRPTMKLRIAIALIALALLTTTGCAAVYDGRLAWRDGWREATVTEVNRGDRLSRGATTDCRTRLPHVSPGEATFARVTYRPSRVRLGVIVPIAPGLAVHAGDTVFINIRTCKLEIQRTSTR